MSKFLEHVAYRVYLVLSKQWQVQQNLYGFCVSSHNHKLGDTTVQCLGSCTGIRASAIDVRVEYSELQEQLPDTQMFTFICPLAKLLVVCGLLDYVQDSVCQLQ